jgi:hypothetical protein
MTSRWCITSICVTSICLGAQPQGWSGQHGYGERSNSKANRCNASHVPLLPAPHIYSLPFMWLREDCPDRLDLAALVHRALPLHRTWHCVAARRLGIARSWLPTVGRDAPKLRPTFARVKEHRVLRSISARSVERDGSPHILVHRGDLHAVLVARDRAGCGSPRRV